MHRALCPCSAWCIVNIHADGMVLRLPVFASSPVKLPARQPRHWEPAAPQSQPDFHFNVSCWDMGTAARRMRRMRRSASVHLPKGMEHRAWPHRSNFFPSASVPDHMLALRRASCKWPKRIPHAWASTVPWEMTCLSPSTLRASKLTF